MGDNILWPRKLIEFALVACLVLGISAPAVAQSGTDWQSCARADVQPDAAIKACATILRASGLTPRNTAIAYYNTGIAFMAKRDWDRAIANFDQAIRNDAAYPAALVKRGLAREAKGDRAGAQRDFRAALATGQPNNFEERWAQDTAHQRLGEPQIAAVPAPVELPAVPELAPLPLPPVPQQAEPDRAPPQAVPRPIPPNIAALPRASATDPGARIALVIGNDRYEQVPSLQKAVNDARAIGAALEQIGFTVIRAENANRRTMNQRLVEFSNRVNRGDTAFFYFAGHGVEIKSVNYLLPTDTPTAVEGEEALITSEGIAADGIIDLLQGRGARVAVMVLDACRENPFKKAGSRGIGRGTGLGQMAPSSEGVFVVFSAGYGQEALDRLSDSDPNPNSVFTRSFVRLLATPGMSMQEIAKATQGEVRRLAASVNHVQLPAYYDQIADQFVLAPKQ
jgi:tetratricopeptide (TPR) repeat protein